MLDHCWPSLTVLSWGVSACVLLPVPAGAQARFAPGDRVHCDWLQNGRHDPGTVVPFTSTDLDQSGRWYRVRLDGDKIPNSTVECMIDRLRAASATPLAGTPAPNDPSAARSEPRMAAAAPTAPSVARPADPPRDSSREAAPQSAAAAYVKPAAPAGTLRPLPGTGWKIDYGRGKTGDVFLFCSTGTWQIVPARGSIGAVGRSFRVSGTTLTTVNRDDGQVQTWRMSGSEGVMAIHDGRQTLTLHYNGTTQCR